MSIPILPTSLHINTFAPTSICAKRKTPASPSPSPAAMDPNQPPLDHTTPQQPNSPTTPDTTLIVSPSSSSSSSCSSSRLAKVARTRIGRIGSSDIHSAGNQQHQHHQPHEEEAEEESNKHKQTNEKRGETEITPIIPATPAAPTGGSSRLTREEELSAIGSETSASAQSHPSAASSAMSTPIHSISHITSGSTSPSWSRPTDSHMTPMSALSPSATSTRPVGESAAVQPHTHLTVNTSPSLRIQATQQRASPTNSPTHSPTSMASQSKPPGVTAIALSPCNSPQASSSPRLRISLSPRCPHHSHGQFASQSPGRSSGSIAGSPRAGASSPCRSPAHTPGSWQKPNFLSRLKVNIPEVSPLIASPVACGSTPTIPTRSYGVAGRDLAAAMEGTSTMLPIVPDDGVVSAGDHFAISMLKGRRRNMEDMWLQASIDMDEHTDTAGESPLAVTSRPNFFGLCDGHGKLGGLVAQLAAQLLPTILQKQIHQPSTLMTVTAAGSNERPTYEFAMPTPMAMSTAATPLTANRSTFLSPIASFSPAVVRSALDTSTSKSSSLPASSAMPSPAFSTSAVSSVIGLTDADAPAPGDDEFHLDDAPTDAISMALQEAYMRLDQAVIEGNYTGGTTCTTALIRTRTNIHNEETDATNPPTSSATIYVSNVGDSRCVLSKSGRAVALTSDHKPDRADERARVEKAGGQVVFVSGWRVDGILNISRAIGDAHLKDLAHPHRGRVIARPEITVHDVTDEDEFIILASDGVWGRVDSQVAVDIVRRVLMQTDQAIESTDEEDARMAELPRMTSLTHEHSYIRPPTEENAKSQPLNPIDTPHRLQAVSSSSGVVAAASDTGDSNPPPTYQRVGSTDTLCSIATPKPGFVGLNTNGTMSTTMTDVTHTGASGGSSMPSPARLAKADSTLTSPTGRTINTSVSSTQLTTPIGAMRVRDGNANPADGSDAADFAHPQPAPPCCWSAVSHRPDLIAAASEALIHYAYDDMNSMDNISVAIVVLAPYTQTNNETDAEQHVHTSQE